MGKIYTKYVLQGEQILATFENGTVYSPTGTLGIGHQILMYHDGGRIYRSVSSPFGDGFPNVLARCDKFGRIETEDGTRLGYCENGEVKDSSGSTVAYYEGDMFGAAAAACAVIFSLSDTSNPPDTNTDDDDSGRIDSSKSASSSTNTNDFSTVSVIFSILGAVLIALWKFIKTIPFWGPYGSILLIVFTAGPRPAGSSSGGGSAGAVGLFFLAYLILHTILLFKCKKWEAKHKYWPIYVGFILLVVTFVPMWAVPAVAFQVGVLIYTKQQRRENTFFSTATPETLSPLIKKLPIFVVLPLIAIVLCSIFRLVQYSGYKSFVKDYFEAIETGDQDQITQFYSWDYVEEKNEKNKSNLYSQFFVWDSLEYYIESNDKYYRWFAGEEIEKIEISRTEKNMLSSTPQIEVEVYVVFEGRADDVIVFIDMERGSDGWYMTGTDAYYASDEAMG